MQKIKDWVKDHQSLIIGCLLLVIMLKGCTSCNNKRQYEYRIAQYEIIVDSLQTTLDERLLDKKDLCDTIHSLRAENTVLKSVIKEIKADKEYYRKQNRNLAVVAENLSKQDTIK